MSETGLIFCSEPVAATTRSTVSPSRSLDPDRVGLCFIEERGDRLERQVGVGRATRMPAVRLASPERFAGAASRVSRCEHQLAFGDLVPGVVPGMTQCRSVPVHDQLAEQIFVGQNQRPVVGSKGTPGLRATRGRAVVRLAVMADVLRRAEKLSEERLPILRFRHPQHDARRGRDQWFSRPRLKLSISFPGDEDLVDFLGGTIQHALEHRKLL